MYQVQNQAVADMIESFCRSFRMRLSIDTGIVIGGDRITQADSDVSTTAKSSDIEFGAVTSTQWTLNVYDSKHTLSLLGHKVQLSIYLADLEADEATWADVRTHTWGELKTGTWNDVHHISEILCGESIPLGEYTIIKSKRTGDGIDITLCDALYYADKIYTPTISLPAMASAVENDICNQLGIENGNTFAETAYLADKGPVRLKEKNGRRLKVKGFDFVISAIPEPGKTTMRQMLGYIASAMGQFGFIDRFGKYVRKWYGDPVKTLDHSTIDTPTLSERSNKISGIRCTSGQTVRFHGTETDRVIDFENPYMTNGLFDSLWHRLRKQNLIWYTAEVFHRLGDPRFDPGDVFDYTEDRKAHNLPLTGLSYSFDGGLSAQLKSHGVSVEEQI